MNLPRRFLAVMHEGKPIVQARVAFARYLKEHFGNGEEVDVIVQRHARESTDQQRAYYRAVIVPIVAEYMGEADLDAAHEAVAFKFLRIENHPITDTPRRKSTSRKSMTVPEFSDYLERVIAWLTVDCGQLVPPAERNPAKREKKGQAA